MELRYNLSLFLDLLLTSTKGLDSSFSEILFIIGNKIYRLLNLEYSS